MVMSYSSRIIDIEAHSLVKFESRWSSPTQSVSELKLAKISGDPRGTLHSVSSSTDRQQTRVLIGYPEEYIHGHTLSIMLTKIVIKFC